ncbi:MAG: hypothetical protein ACI83Y_002846, partial [Candidatus Azotimanducaceae bacterium]
QIGQKIANLTDDSSICNESGVPFEPHQRPIERALAVETVTGQRGSSRLLCDTPNVLLSVWRWG